MQEEVKQEINAFMEVQGEKFPLLINKPGWVESIEIEPHQLIVVNGQGQYLDLHFLQRAGYFTRRSKSEEPKKQRLTKQFHFPNPLLRGIGLVQDKNFLGVTIATSNSMHAVWIRQALSEDVPYLMFSNFSLPAGVAKITASSMSKESLIVERVNDGASFMVLGTQNTELFYFNPTKLDKDTSMKGKHQAIRSVAYLLKQQSYLRSTLMKAFSRAHQAEPRGAILAIQTINNLVFAATSQEQVLCRSFDKNANWCLNMGEQGTAIEVLLSARRTTQIEGIHNHIVLGVAIQTNKHEWMIRGYSLDINGNNPTPLTQEPFQVLYQVTSIQVDPTGNIVYAGYQKPNRYKIPQIYVNDCQVWTLENQYDSLLTHHPHLCGHSFKRAIPLSSINPSQILTLAFSKKERQLLVVRNEGITFIIQPQRVLKDWVLRRQGRPIALEDEHIQKKDAP